MRTGKIFISLVLLSCSVFGQTAPPAYYFHVKQADSLWKLKEYKKAGFAFSSAFSTLGNKGLTEDRYNAARVWSLANVPDSAFDCLSRIINKRLFTDYNKLIAEKDFTNLQSDTRWKPLVDTLEAHKNEIRQSKLIKTFILLKNSESYPVSVYWMDYSRSEIFYFDLNPNEERYQETYAGQVWLIRNKKNGKLVLELVASRQNKKFDTKGEKIETFVLPDKKTLDSLQK